MRLTTIFLISIFIHSCSDTQLMLSVNFPKSSPILTDIKKKELKRNIAIKNSELFTEQELEQLGVLEVVIK